MKKNNKKTTIALISAIVVLGVTCVISIAYNFLGGFYFGRISKYNTMLGEDLYVKVEEQGVWGLSCNFSGTLILGSNFKQNVYLEVGNTLEPLFLRAKAYISGTDYDVGVSGVTNWIKCDDGYYYFNQPVNMFDKLQLCNNLIFSEDINLDSYKDYILTFIVEAQDVEWVYSVTV